MDILKIEAGEDSPLVSFNPVTNMCQLTGESRPENAGKFYAPLLDWIKQYETLVYYRKNKLGIDPPLVFQFRLEYFNSTSAKYLIDLVFALKKIQTEGHPVRVEWFYDKQDTDMLDAGRHMAEMAEWNFSFVETT